MQSSCSSIILIGKSRRAPIIFERTGRPEKSALSEYTRTNLKSYNINLSNPPDQIPTVKIILKNMQLLLLIDSGSQCSILKFSDLPNEYKTSINNKNVVKLRGITSLPVLSKGCVIINIYGTCITFHLVGSEFKILQNGILGNDFLYKSK